MESRRQHARWKWRWQQLWRNLSELSFFPFVPFRLQVYWLTHSHPELGFCLHKSLNHTDHYANPVQLDVAEWTLQSLNDHNTAHLVKRRGVFWNMFSVHGKLIPRENFRKKNLHMSWQPGSGEKWGGDMPFPVIT